MRWRTKKRKNSRVNNLMREIAHAQKRNPLSDLDEILQHGRYPRRNHVGKFWWRSVKEFRGGGGGSNFGLYHWLWSSSLQHSRTTRASVWSETAVTAVQSQAARYRQHCVNDHWLCQWERAIFDLHWIDTPQPITKKFVTGDYLGDPYGCAKLGAGGGETWSAEVTSTKCKGKRVISKWQISLWYIKHALNSKVIWQLARDHNQPRSFCWWYVILLLELI